MTIGKNWRLHWDGFDEDDVNVTKRSVAPSGRAKGSGGRPNKGDREFLGFRVDAQVVDAIDAACKGLGGAYRSDWIVAALTVAQQRTHAVVDLVARQSPMRGGIREYLGARIAPALFLDVEHSRERHGVRRNTWVEAAIAIALEHQDEVAAAWRDARAAERTRSAQAALDYEEAYNRSA